MARCLGLKDAAGAFGTPGRPIRTFQKGWNMVLTFGKKTWGAHGIVLCILAGMGLTGPVAAEQSGVESELRMEIQELRQSLEAMRRAYEARIGELERRIEAMQSVPRGDAAAAEAEALRRAAAAEAAETPERGAETLARAQTGPISQNAFNPRITVFGDLLGRADDRPATNDEGNDVSDRIGLREVELDLRADVDPYAKGVLILALEEEDPNVFDPAIEEGYVTFETLPWNLHAKAGRFRTSFGQINKLHQHDLPQVDYPLPVRAFLGEEGDNQTGLAVSVLAPSLLGHVIEVEFQALNGESETILAGDTSAFPAFLGHLKCFRDLAESQFVELGASHLFGYTDEENELASRLSGLDFLYKWKPLERGEYRSFVLQGEVFYLDRQRPDTDLHSLGAYAYAQVQAARRWYLGIRGDVTEFPDDAEHDAWSASAYVSYYTTEFLRLRLGFQHLEDDQDGPLDTLFLQLTFVFGAHPTEPYWVNR
ncbi:MAG: hypothetical protein HYU36_11840 [Planctomycetes bacterium]|nr:hypothetical protein [Planctomycetota bacterium]